MAADEKYLALQRDNLTIRIQMQLYQKQKAFSKFFATFLKSSLNLKHFQWKDTLHRFCILKRQASEDAWTSNMVNVPKHSWNLHHSSFIIFTGHWQENFVPRSLSYWHAKSCDCFLTLWLRMKRILFLIETI